MSTRRYGQSPAEQEELTREVARLTRSGRTGRQIRWELGLSTRGVVRHRGRARRSGLLPPHPRSPAGRGVS